MYWLPKESSHSGRLRRVRYISFSCWDKSSGLQRIGRKTLCLPYSFTTAKPVFQASFPRRRVSVSFPALGIRVSWEGFLPCYFFIVKGKNYKV